MKLENIDKIPLCDVSYAFLLLLDIERPKAQCLIKRPSFSTFITEDLNLSNLQVSRDGGDNHLFSGIWTKIIARVSSDFVSNSYGESLDSSCEKSWALSPEPMSTG